jgi:hypothetical protein
MFMFMFMQGKLRLLKVKQRYEKPTLGGWSDILLIVMFPSGAGAHIPCEIQFVDKRMMVAREGLGGHDG